MNKISFINDNNVSIHLPNSLLNKYNGTEFKEPLHRKTINYLIQNNFIDKTGNIIDLGAWIGDNSIPWALNISGTLYAIDPSPSNIAFIKQVAKVNNIHNIKYITEAIGSKKEKISTTDNLQHCSFEVFNLEKNNQIVLTSTTLDNLYDGGIIDNISYIHLDVENFEYKVLKGAKNLINMYRPIISFEQHLDEENQPEKVINYLNKFNYKSYVIDEVLVGNRKDCRNFIAFPYNLSIKIEGLIRVK